MKPANDTTLRVIADGLINRAECRPKGCEGARLLREAAANLLDADMHIQRDDGEMLRRVANDPDPQAKGDAA